MASKKNTQVSRARIEAVSASTLTPQGGIGRARIESVSVQNNSPRTRAEDTLAKVAMSETRRRDPKAG